MFKEEYRKEMQKITPDSSFLQGLASEMEREERNLREKDHIKRNRKSGKKVLAWSAAAAAALICIGISILWRKTNALAPANENLMKQNAGGILEQTENKEGIFNGSSWYGNETEPEEIYKILMEKMTEDPEMKLTVSDEENFQHAEQLSSEKTAEMAQMLAEGHLWENGEEAKDLSTENPVYYLAEFQDKTVVKFVVYDDRYFYCREIDGIFILNE